MVPAATLYCCAGSELRRAFFATGMPRVIRRSDSWVSERVPYGVHMCASSRRSSYGVRRRCIRDPVSIWETGSGATRPVRTSVQRHYCTFAPFRAPELLASIISTELQTDRSSVVRKPRHGNAQTISQPIFRHAAVVLCSLHNCVGQSDGLPAVPTYLPTYLPTPPPPQPNGSVASTNADTGPRSCTLLIVWVVRLRLAACLLTVSAAPSSAFVHPTGLG